MYRRYYLLNQHAFWCLLMVYLLLSSPLLGAARHDKGGFLVYPDRAHQALTLQLPHAAPHTGLQLSILDTTGHIVYRKPLPERTAPLVSLPVGNLAAGTYLLIIEGPDGYNVAQRVVL